MSFVPMAAPSAYVTAAPNYSVPAYVVDQPAYGPPIPLTPVIMPESPLLAEEEGGSNDNIMSKLKKVLAVAIALPLAITIPLAIVVVGIVAVIIVPILVPNFARKVIGHFVATTIAPITSPTTPTPFIPYTDHQYNYYSNSTATPSGFSYRKRSAGNETDSSSSSSGLPVLSLAQVDKLTQVVFSALRSQECVQRLLCEAGQLSRNVSDTAHSVARYVEPFVPESVRSSYDIFVQAEKCEQYACGSLNVKK